VWQKFPAPDYRGLDLGFCQIEVEPRMNDEREVRIWHLTDVALRAGFGLLLGGIADDSKAIVLPLHYTNFSEDMMELKGRVAIVTGGAGGLGVATARALAKAGVNVCVTYKSNKDAALSVCEEIDSLGQRGIAVELDQSEPASVNAAIARAAQDLGGIDILINNAGAAQPVPFPDLEALTPEIWDDLMNTNLRGPFLVTRAAAPYLRKSDGGRVVNIGAMIGLKPAGSSIAQAVSKAGVIHLTRCLAVALAPDVTVNCVAPGLMEGTNITSGLPDDYLEGLRKMAILNKTTGIEDVVMQIVQFCQAETVTGQVLVIDGGIHFH
jgi:3-oxoacyl-[acyl-carrier protein] reductase